MNRVRADRGAEKYLATRRKIPYNYSERYSVRNMTKMLFCAVS